MSSKGSSDTTGGGTGTTGTEPRLSRLADNDGVSVWDPIDGVGFDLLTDDEPDIETGDADAVHFPVDAAVSVSVREIGVRRPAHVSVREGGTIAAYFRSGDGGRVDAGSYDVEFSEGLPMKVYLAVDEAFEVSVSDDGIPTLSFDEETRVTVGVRSLHEQPAATVTTSPGPRDAMRAVSTFGSALKTTSPMRSFPTLRGHPPEIEVGTEFEAPAGVEPPDVDVRIEVPERLDRVFGVASLAHYTGATVEPGDEPRLVAAGESFSLTGPDGFHDRVADVLERLHTIDCLVRDNSLYPGEIDGVETFRERYDGDCSALREGSLSDRIVAAMNVPESAFDDLVPQWPSTYDVEASHEHVSALPYAAAELAHVRCPTERDHGPAPGAPPEPVETFFRTTTAGGESTLGTDGGTFTLPETDSLAHTYIGTGVPVGAANATPEQLSRRHSTAAPERSEITVHVVCNDDRMIEEIDGEPYGLRDAMSYRFEVHHDLTNDELRNLLKTEMGLFHFVGHVEPDGLQCSDGALDTTTLADTGVRTFFLNACNSAAQARGLVDAGARGGVATVSSVPNSVATGAGRSMARLLNAGATLHVALELLREEYLTGHRYTVVGDGSVAVVEGLRGFSITEVEDGSESGTYSVRAQPVSKLGPGSVNSSLIVDEQRYWLSGNSMVADVTGEAIAGSGRGGSYPVVYRGELRWTDEFGNGLVDT